MSESVTNSGENRLIKIDLDLLIMDLWQKRLPVFGITMLLALMALAGSFFVTPLFTAEVSFLPVGSKQLSVFLKSRSTATLVLARLPELKNYLRISYPDNNQYAIELSRRLTIKPPAREDQPYILRVELANASMAADVANTYLELVAKHLNSAEYDMARRNTGIIREQYEFFATALREAEASLRSFQEKHGIIFLDSQTAATVGLVAQIEARIVKKQIELEALQESLESPILRKRTNEIAALKDTLNELKGEQEGLIFTTGLPETGGRSAVLSGAPQLRIEHQKLRRDVNLAEQACLTLQAQLTAAKIQEEKEAIAFVVVDPAIVPVKPSHPNRGMFFLFGAMLGLLLAVSKSFYTTLLEQTAARNSVDSR